MGRTPCALADFSRPLRTTYWLLVIFGLFLIVVLWVSIYYKVLSERQQAVDGAIKETANFARAFEEHSKRTIKSADEIALFLKHRYEQEGKDLDIPALKKELRFASQVFVLLSVIDEHGDLVVSSQVPFVPSNLSDREHFLVHKNADNGQLFISKPVLGRSSGKWSVQLTRRVNTPDGAFGGVVVVSLDPFYFAEFYRQVELGADSVVALVGLDGVIRARYNAGGDNTPGLSIRGAPFAPGQSGHDVVVSPVDGIKRVYSHKALDEYPLVAVVGVAEHEVMKSVNQRTTGYLLMATMVSCVILAFIAMLLTAAARRDRAEKALLDSHTELEIKVAQRTRDLSAANNDLQKTNADLAKEVAVRQQAEKELRQKTSEIRRMAFTDALTGLPNRAALNGRLSLAMARASAERAAGAVVFIDLDDLKTINDSFGHTYGDALITTAAERIRRTAGDDAFVARAGGDEFVVILPGVSDREQIGRTVDAIIAALADDIEVHGVHFHTTASAGIAVYPADGITTEDIFKNADNAMYAAKRAGKNRRRFFEPAMHSEAYDRVVLLNSLRGAVKRGEFLLHYQPQTDLRSGAVVGFEALLRWNSREHGGFIPSARFIPLAEQSGLIQEIGAWVLREASLFARRLSEAGQEGVFVTVNLSPFQLCDEGFTEKLHAALKDAGVEPKRLELEIAENALTILGNEHIRILEDLHAAGVRLALDGFGTGYSSLIFLYRLPVDTLTLNTAFLDLVMAEGDRKSIIGAITDMAHDMGMTVVAEGVKTLEERDYLLRCGCDRIQGRVVSMPLPEDDAVRFLAAHK